MTESTSSHPKTDATSDATDAPLPNVGQVLIVGRGQFAQDVKALFQSTGIDADFTIVTSYLTALAHAQASLGHPCQSFKSCSSC